MAGKLEELDMEDGEIVDSDEEIPIKGSVPDLVSSVSVRKSDPDLVAEAKPTLPLKPLTVTYRQAPAINYSDDSEDESEDSEDEGNSSPQKAKRMSFGSSASNFSNSLFVNPLLSQKAGLNTGVDVWGVDMSKPPKKKCNNIWGSVIQEQTIEKEVSSFGVEKIPDEFMLDRDVESYNYMNAKNDIRPTVPSSGSEMDSASEDIAPDITDKESFSLEPAKKCVGVKDRLDDKKPKWDRSLNDIIRDDMDDGACDNTDNQGSRHARKRTIKDRLGEEEKSNSVKDRLDKKHVKFRLSERTLRERFIEVTTEDSTATIVNAIVENLQEPNVALVTGIVETIGKDKAIELMYATESMEKQGGMMTVNGSRRRTPGGVFIQLLKTDPDVTKEEVKTIFQEEKKQWNRRVKEIRKTRDRKKCDVFEDRLKSELQRVNQASKKADSTDCMDTEDLQPSDGTSAPPEKVEELVKRNTPSEHETLKDESYEDLDFDAEVDIQLE